MGTDRAFLFDLRGGDARPALSDAAPPSDGTTDPARRRTSARELELGARGRRRARACAERDADGRGSGRRERGGAADASRAWWRARGRVSDDEEYSAHEAPGRGERSARGVPTRRLQNLLPLALTPSARPSCVAIGAGLKKVANSPSTRRSVFERPRHTPRARPSLPRRHGRRRGRPRARARVDDAREIALGVRQSVQGARPSPRVRSSIALAQISPRRRTPSRLTPDPSLPPPHLAPPSRRSRRTSACTASTPPSAPAGCT